MRSTTGGPRCSVIIPCFNAAPTIFDTLQSALRQSVREIEVIVVDDGSSDRTPEIVAAIALADARVRLIRQANGGVSAARNAGIAEARARIVAFLDADDLWAPDHLATHIRRIEYNVRLGLSFSPARFIDAHGRVTGCSRPKLEGITPADLLRGNPTTTCSTVVVRREVFKEVGMFRTHMRHNEDQEWLFRVALSGWVMAGDATPRVDYRTNPDGLAADLDAMFRGFEIMLEEARKDAPQLVARNRARATAAMQRYLARRAIRLGQSPAIARRFIFAALRSSPRLILTEPRATFATLAAALLPQMVLAPLLHRVRPMTAAA